MRKRIVYYTGVQCRSPASCKRSYFQAMSSQAVKKDACFQVMKLLDSKPEFQQLLKRCD